MFENVDGRTDDGRTTDAGVTGILIAHLRAFGSGELIMIYSFSKMDLLGKNGVSSRPLRNGLEPF